MKVVGESGEEEQKDEKGPFAENEAGKGAEDIAQGEAFKRPEVEEKEEERKSDEHGLGKKTAQEEEEGCREQGEAPFCGSSGGHGCTMCGCGGRSTREGLEVAEDGGEGKEGGEGILALSNPSDRFDPEGVDCPKGGSDERKPGPVGGASEDEKKEYSIGGVQKDVGEVKAPRGIWGRAKAEVVKEEGDPKKRSVHHLIAMQGGESVAEGFPGESIENNRIIIDERGVVESHESVADGGSEEGEGNLK